jgi:hypothetical protein
MKQAASTADLFHVRFFVGFFCDPENGGDFFSETD